MTVKEQLHRLVEELSEAEAADTLEYAASRHAREDSRPGDIIDEWGNLSAMRRASSARKMRRLAAEEAAAGHDPW
jgi:hypothetical protein